MDKIQLKNIAIEAALAAGKIIREHLDNEISVEEKKGPESYAAQVVTTVDRKCEKVILDHLFQSCTEYNLALLSEETEDDGSRFDKEYFWCIDPMDGTLAFINKEPGFSVSIALVAKDGTPHIGVVYDPSNKIMYHAIKDQGAYKNNRPWKIKQENDFLTYVTDKALSDTPGITEIQNLLNMQIEKFALAGLKEINGGGSVINAIRVLENGPACMIKLPKKEKGGGSLWDFAATACIYNELRLPATNYAGKRLDLNKKEDSYMNHEGVYFCNPSLD